MNASNEPIRIIVVDDHPIVRQGLRSLLSSYQDLQIVAETESALQALEAALRLRPQIALVDIRLQASSGIQLAQRLRRELPHLRVIILTSYDDDEYLIGALRAGVQAYLLKSTSDERLVDAIRRVVCGERLISPELLDRVLHEFADFRTSQVQKELGLDAEELQVLAMIASGASNEEISASLSWSKTSIKRKIHQIFEKLSVGSRAEAAAEAVRRGLV